MQFVTTHKKGLFGLTLVAAVALLFLHMYIQPEFMSPGKASFVQFMLIRSQQSNDDILLQREKLLILYKQFNKHRPLSPLSREWLFYLAARYDVPTPDFSKRDTWETLINRVDIVPNSLTIAQAIDESEWGQSRFAHDGNNYFGVWCYIKGCGIEPNNKTPGIFYAVKRYPSALDSVRDYMNNLDSHDVYHQFRDLRAQLRQSNKPITGMALAGTLVYYSQRRGDYVVAIRNLITNYDLAKYDRISDQETAAASSGLLSSSAAATMSNNAAVNNNNAASNTTPQ
ncbi:MAG: glucosaminidase domain-containing protein [Gammaproteobacteria bacterium]|nr:glucosaminidase domain-containing protein [Gammaproteobacteria bacterium]